VNKLRGRVIQLIPAILIQLAEWILLFTVLEPYAYYIRIAGSIFAVIFVLVIIRRVDETVYKEAWIILLLMFPLFGVIMYMLFGNKRTGKQVNKAIEESKKELDYHFPESAAIEGLRLKEHRLAGSLECITAITGMHAYKNEGTRYYPLGENAFPDMIEDIKNAKKYVFMEYFIFERGQFEGALTEAMAEKAAQGVDVRIMYDDLGSIATFSKNNVKWLNEHGIKVVIFNPIQYITLKINNRDHRKMTVIDGEIAYSGGINIADEYINVKEKYGHWKDTSFRVTGDAVISYAYMFTEFWNAFSDDKIPKDYLVSSCKDSGEDGYIFSYYENPMSVLHVSNHLYIDLLNRAEKYFWIFTPYLMLGDELQSALRRAAAVGIDVRIVVPGIPDKKMAYAMTRSNFRPLLELGVRIYEYTPGFIHAKSVVCDDKLAAVGTVNLDFRSLFLHFENNSLFYESGIVKDIKADFEDTFAKCTERTLDDGGPGVRHRIGGSILRLLSPLC